MSNIWTGADPTEAVETHGYELGSVVEALEAVSLTGIRVWAPADAVVRTGRKGHVWSMAGVLLATVTMPDSLASGWSTHALDTPMPLDSGDFVVVSYETDGNYGAISAAFADSVISADGAMCFPASHAVRLGGVEGNGRFHDGPGSAPDASSGAFYGVDAVYTVPGAGTAPTLTSLALTADGLDVVANLTATDPDGLVGATYAVDWGDGNASSGAGASFSHTYAIGGVKAVLGSVTDSTGLTGYRAGAVELINPAAGLNTQAILDAAASHAEAIGHFEWVTSHEPKSAPQDIGAAFWAERITPVPANSGLDITSAVLVLNCRIYTSMLTEPQDLIDPRLIDATDALMGAYSGDFTLGGLVECVDLLGMTGERLEARAGYMEQDRKIFRIMTISVPVIVAEAWEQAP